MGKFVFGIGPIPSENLPRLPGTGGDRREDPHEILPSLQNPFPRKPVSLDYFTLPPIGEINCHSLAYTFNNSTGSGLPGT